MTFICDIVFILFAVLISIDFTLCGRIKSEYDHHESLSGSIGVKIVAPDCARAIAGTPISKLCSFDSIAPNRVLWIDFCGSFIDCS